MVDYRGCSSLGGPGSAVDNARNSAWRPSGWQLGNYALIADVLVNHVVPDLKNSCNGL